METDRSTNQRVSTLLYTILICFCFQSMIIAELKVSCQPGWNVSKHSGTCVMIGREAKTWAAAREDCKKYKADHVKIIGNAMNNFLLDLLKTETSPVFIGLLPQKSPGLYNWTSDGGEAHYINFFHWPGADTWYKRCLQMNTHGERRGNWFHVDCNETLKYICERPSGPQSNLAPALCRPSWVFSESSGTCFTKNWNQADWKEARAICKKDNADLLMILDETMKTLVSDQFITDYFEQYWLGLTDNMEEGEFRWLHNGEKVDSSWYNDITTVNCALINTPGRAGQWTLRDCDARHPYICEVPAGPTSKDQSERCPTKYILRPSVDKCYKAVKESIRRYQNWTSARIKCSADKGDLVTVADNATNQFILDELSMDKETPYWIGLSDHKQEDTFRWLDEEEVATYTNWFNGQQSEAGIQLCGSYHYGISRQDCWRRFLYICETYAVCENGTKCPRRCGSSCAAEACDTRTGLCIPAGAGNQGTECKDGKGCTQEIGKCSMHCYGEDRRCDKDGKCSEGCHEGYWGDKCDNECETGTYGRNCNETCNMNCADNQCNITSGECISGCDSGYKGEMCDKEIPEPRDKRKKENRESPSESNLALIVGAIVSLIVIALFVTAVVIMRKKFKSDVLGSLPDKIVPRVSWRKTEQTG